MESPEIDPSILAEFERVRADAAEVIAGEAQYDLTGDIRFIRRNLVEVGQPLAKLLSQHDVFGGNVTWWFGEDKPLSLNPYNQVAQLLRLSNERGTQAALDWLRRLHCIRKADLRLVSVVHNVSAMGTLDLSNGVTLLPISDLAPSQNAKVLRDVYESWRPGFSSSHVPIAAISTAKAVLATEPDKPADKTPSKFDHLIQQTVGAFALGAEAAPYIGVSWIDFVDPELALADRRYWRQSTAEGGYPHIQPVLATTDLVAQVERYLALPLAPKARARFDIALQRLSLARRRSVAADRAIDGSICLEALLADPQSKVEIGHRLRNRAAIVLGGGLPDRKGTSDDRVPLSGVGARGVCA